MIHLLNLILTFLHTQQGLRTARAVQAQWMVAAHDTPPCPYSTPSRISAVHRPFAPLRLLGGHCRRNKSMLIYAFDYSTNRTQRLGLVRAEKAAQHR